MSTDTGSHKTACGALAAAFCVILAGSCGPRQTSRTERFAYYEPGPAPTRAPQPGPQGPTEPAPAPSPRTRRPQPPAPTPSPDDWGQDWTQAARSPAAPPVTGTSARSTVWTIVLATFSAEGQHQTAAANMMSQLRTLAPQLGDVWIHTTDKGSLVVFGRYDGPKETRAQADLKMVKGITIQDRPMFARAMLTRVHVGAPAGPVSPLALMSARQRYPNVDPLYTVEVAMWSDFGTGELTLKQIQRLAENYTRELRTQGFDAYFYHDYDTRISTVTVGLFNRTAIDHRSGLYSPAVQSVMDRFPQRLVNGEPLLELIDSRNPDRGTRVQKPMLVHVPKE